MVSHTQSDDDDGELEALCGRLNSGKTLLEALQCLAPPSTTKSLDVEVRAHPTNGARFSTVIPGSVLSSVTLPARSFAEYKSSVAKIRVNLSLLIDCLSLPPPERPAVCTLRATETVLRVTLEEEDGAHTSCRLRTIEGGGAALEAMRNAPRGTVIGSCIVKSEVLREAITELDYGGAETACLALNPQKPRMVLSSPQPPRRGVSIEFPDPLDAAQDCFDEFRCERRFRTCYRLDHLTRVAKALAMSDVAKISVNDIGTLSVMCKMMAKGAPQVTGCFFEFMIVALEVEDDDMDENDVIDYDEDEQDAYQ